MKQVQPSSTKLSQRLPTFWRVPRRHLGWIVIAALLFGAVAASSFSPAVSTSASQSVTVQTTLTTHTSPATQAPQAADTNTLTNGIIIGGVVLVLIIIGGTLRALRPHSSE